MKARLETITQEQLKQILSYNPETGQFVRKNGRKCGVLNKRTGYRAIKIGGRSGRIYYEHRLAFFYMTGEWPPHIDHINRKKDDNRWSNLRSASTSENMRNTGLQKNNTSGVKGVAFCNYWKVWKAYIGLDYKMICLGNFKSKSEAIEARRRAEPIYHGDFAVTS